MKEKTQISLKEEVETMINASSATRNELIKLVELYEINNFNRLVDEFVKAFPLFDSYTFCKEFATKNKLLKGSNPDVVRETINSFMQTAEGMIMLSSI